MASGTLYVPWGLGAHQAPVFPRSPFPIPPTSQTPGTNIAISSTSELGCPSNSTARRHFTGTRPVPTNDGLDLDWNEVSASESGTSHGDGSGNSEFAD